MEELPLLKDITYIFALSIVILLLCNRLGIPNIVGFLLTGVLSGPHGLGLIYKLSEVETLANIGIILLLFTVGMEVSIKRLLEYRRFLLVGGFLQVVLTIFAVFLCAKILGRPTGESIFFGCLVSLSSTAIVMRTLDERGEASSPHGKVSFSILIFQDLIIVPMVLFIPIFAGKPADFNLSFYISIGKGILVLAAAFIMAQRIVPMLLFYIAKTKSRELFLLGILAICTSVVWISSSAGVSLSLGAFLAGLIISESEYCQEAIGGIIPFQDIFTSFFFVSMGMLLDIGFLIQYPLLVCSIAFGIIVLKASLVSIVTLILGMPLRTALLCGLAICQVGEFSFVLLKTGMEHGIASNYHFQLFLAFSLLTMALTPTLIGYSIALSRPILKIPLPAALKFGLKPVQLKGERLTKDHVIIIGMGVTGANLARAARESEIPYVILDMNAETVRLERERGEPIYFGDATHEIVLNHANIKDAKAVAVSIDDHFATMRIVKVVRKLNPAVYLIVRTHFSNEIKPLYQMGADDVIPDEFGSSIEIFSRVLAKFDVNSEDISRFISELRSENYEILRLLYHESTAFSTLTNNLGELEIETFKVGKNSPLAGKSLKEIHLRHNYGVTVVLIYRGKKIITNPTAIEIFKSKDLFVLIGSKKELTAVRHLFRSVWMAN